MAFELKSNSGILFKNDRKKEAKHPDYTGSIKDDNGREFDLSAWLKESKSGKKFLSLSLKSKANQPAAQDDDFPF